MSHISCEDFCQFNEAITTLIERLNLVFFLHWSLDPLTFSLFKDLNCYLFLIVSLVIVIVSLLFEVKAELTQISEHKPAQLPQPL